MNWCTLRMSLAEADFTANRSKRWPMPNKRDGPVGQQVLVADVRPLRAAGGALGVQHHVHPRGRAVDLAEAGGVVALLAADHLGHGPQHGDVRRRGLAAERGRPPQAEEPRQPRVLHDQLGRLARTAPPARCAGGCAAARCWRACRPRTRPPGGRRRRRRCSAGAARCGGRRPTAARRSPWGWSRRRAPRAGGRACRGSAARRTSCWCRCGRSRPRTPRGAWAERRGPTPASARTSTRTSPSPAPQQGRHPVPQGADQ